MNEIRYYEFDTMFGDPDSQRWTAHERWHGRYSVSDQLTWGEPMQYWDTDLAVATFRPDRQREDVAWTLTATPIVSQYAREILELIAPGDIQFLPVRMENERTGEMLDEPWWVANYLRVFNCLDFHRSWVMHHDLGRPGLRTDLRLPPCVIDSRLLTEQDKIGRVGYSHTDVIVRDSVASVIRRAGITGVEFRRVVHSCDPDAPPPDPEVQQWLMEHGTAPIDEAIRRNRLADIEHWRRMEGSGG